MIRTAACWLIPATLALCQPLPQHVLELSRIRRNMKTALDTLPNYTCLAVTERSQIVRGRPPRPIDTVRVEVAHVERQDMLAWPGAVKFEVADPARMIGSGMFSSGEFFAHLAGVFGQSAVVRYAGPDLIGGRKVLRWDYSLAPSLGTQWLISWAGRTAVAGENGSFWADPESKEVLRLTAESDGLPPEFPIRAVRTTIDYARVKIADRDVYLPQTAVVSVTEATGSRNINTTEFTHCRQYQTESLIRYSVDDRMPEPAGAGPAGVHELVIPSELKIVVELAGDIDPGARTGDRIQGVVVADVVQKKRIVIPRDAVATGRIRRIELDPESAAPRYIIGLEFTDLEWPGYHARFLARLSRAAGHKTRAGEAPGVATFLLDTDPFRIANGTQMIWMTEDITRK